MNRGKETAPLSMRACVERLHALQEHAIILSLETLPTPRIKPADRLDIDDLAYRDDGITFVRAKHGYAEHFDVPGSSGRSRRSESSLRSKQATPPSICPGSS